MVGSDPPRDSLRVILPLSAKIWISDDSRTFTGDFASGVMEVSVDWAVGIFGILTGVLYGWQRVGIPHPSRPRPPLRDVTKFYEWLPRTSARTMVWTIVLVGTSLYFHDGSTASMISAELFLRVVVLLVGIGLGYGIGIQLDSRN